MYTMGMSEQIIQTTYPQFSPDKQSFEETKKDDDQIKLLDTRLQTPSQRRSHSCESSTHRD
jgi:hypothetical protein